MSFDPHSTISLGPPILASSSPRRRQWLEAMRIPYEIWVPEVDETPLPGEDPEPMVLRLAKAKAQIVAAVNPRRWVIAADTTVAVDHHVLNKPADENDAVRMLMLIQGRRHEVHTGFCLMRDTEVHAFVDTAEVHLRPLSERQARWYAKTGEPMDKAGAYGIQGLASKFITRLDGCYFNVVGLPVSLVYRHLRSWPK